MALIIPFFSGIIGALGYRAIFVDLLANPGGLFIPTDLYGLADLNTFLVALSVSSIFSFALGKRSYL